MARRCGKVAAARVCHLWHDQQVVKAEGEVGPALLGIGLVRPPQQLCVFFVPAHTLLASIEHLGHRQQGFLFHRSWHLLAYLQLLCCYTMPCEQENQSLSCGNYATSVLVGCFFAYKSKYAKVTYLELVTIAVLRPFKRKKPSDIAGTLPEARRAQA